MGAQCFFAVVRFLLGLGQVYVSLVHLFVCLSVWMSDSETHRWRPQMKIFRQQMLIQIKIYFEKRFQKIQKPKNDPKNTQKPKIQNVIEGGLKSKSSENKL